jgi:hypothetical protein
LGLLLNGIGGGSPVFADVKAGFFAGGGGGGFFPKPPGAGDCDDSDAFDPPAKLFTLPAIPYFWLSPLAARQPDAACSPCRC